jgi:hypothetical protein
MYVPGALAPEFFQLRPDFVTSTSCGGLQVGNRPCSHGAVPPCRPKQRCKSASTQRGGYSIYGFEGKT